MKQYIFILIMCVCGAIAPQRMWADSQFTYKATKDLSSKFQDVFGSYGTVTCGTWTDADTEVTVTVAGKVTSIGISDFYECFYLTYITIPEGVTSIGNWAFASCAFLTSITLPSTMTSVGDAAFAFCSNLTSITVQSSNATLGQDAFSSCSNLQKIYVPAGSVATYKAATNWSSYANKIKEIPSPSPFDVTITKAGASEATLSKEMATLITINKSAAGAAQVKVQSGEEDVTPTQFELNTRYDFAITKVPTINPGEDDLEGDIIAKAPRRTAALQEPTLTGPALVVRTATAYTTYPLDAEHTDIKLQMNTSGNIMVNGAEVEGVTSIYFMSQQETDLVETGDVNADGFVTIADLALLIDLLNQGGTITNPAADVDGQNGVNIADVHALSNKLLGKGD